MLSDKDFFSPANDLTAGFEVGGASTPPVVSVFPDVSVLNEPISSAAIGNKAAENYGGMTETVSEGGAPGVSLADVPETTSADLGNQLAGGLGDMPNV